MRLLSLFVMAGLASFAQAPRAQGHAYFGIDNPPNGNFNFNSVGIGGDIFIYKGAAFSPTGG